MYTYYKCTPMPQDDTIYISGQYMTTNQNGEKGLLNFFCDTQQEITVLTKRDFIYIEHKQ